MSRYLKLMVLAIVVILMVSCEAETEVFHTPSRQFLASPSEIGKISSKKAISEEDFPTSLDKVFDMENLQDLLLLSAIAPTECGATKFQEIKGNYFQKLMEDPVAMDYFTRYLNLNRYAALLNLGQEEYFGKDGEFTKLVERIKRDLERFWDMEDEITIRGQHNETLNDREKLVEIHWYLIADVESVEVLYAIVDELLHINSLSPNLPESPFFSSDGFATYDNRIVIGDGLIQLFTETGIDPKIVWTGILSHEWAHQIQIDYMERWYPEGAFDNNAERTRLLELEADFFAGYYMTHKKGAAYNWKRANQFFELFFQAGDCSFDFQMHHGTPLQRKEAARAGYELANSAKKKGHILSIQELHRYFLEIGLPQII